MDLTFYWEKINNKQTDKIQTMSDDDTRCKRNGKVGQGRIGCCESLTRQSEKGLLKKKLLFSQRMKLEEEFKEYCSKELKE